jgi:hypothetical protein
MMRKTTLAVFALLCITALTGIASAALPTTVTASIHHGYPDWTGWNCYWDVDVISVTGSSDEIAAGTNNWLGWCVHSGETIGASTHTFTVYSSLNPGSLPATYQGYQWDKINYILNHKGSASMKAIQAAIWTYNGGVPTYTPYNTWDDGADYAALIADAEDNGGGYVPGPGEKYAAILYKEGSQLIFIEVPIPYTNVPEFPTLAVPVGLMVGMVYAVSVAKGRKEETA